MSGHNKWSSIKHKKAAADKKRGKAFTKLIKEITVAARDGGGDPETNPALRTAMNNAKNANMPKDNIERAVKKGTGELEGVQYETATYEGYGPAGVAVLVETLTDNKNRTVAEVRKIFSKSDGKMGENGCVSWMFETKGRIILKKESAGEEELTEKALEAGAEDIKDRDDHWVVFTDAKELYDVSDSLEKNGLEIEETKLTKIPQNTVEVEGRDAEKILTLIDNLEDCDDVRDVHANFIVNIPSE